MDNQSKEARSYNMSRIRSTNTKPEEIVRKYLFNQGFRYRKNDKRYPGKPDIVLPKYKTVVFVNGCFWHGHENCKYYRIPKSNVEYWQNKITNNIKRDLKQREYYEQNGWKIIIIWECQLKSKNREETLAKLKNALAVKNELQPKEGEKNEQKNN